MTDEMMNLCTPLEKSSDADLLREIIWFIAQRLMELRSRDRPALPTASAVRSGSISAMAIETG